MLILARSAMAERADRAVKRCDFEQRFGKLRGARSLSMNDHQILEAADPEALAARLGLEFVQWREGILYVRDEHDLYSIRPVDPSPDGRPAELSMHVTKDIPIHGYVGEEYHTPSEGAAHVGLTVMGAGTDQAATALDGFGRKYFIRRTGNGPMASSYGFGSEEEIRLWQPQHWPRKPTET